MKNTLTPSVAGRFKLEAIKPDGTRRVLADWFDNMILNIGLDHLLEFGSSVRYVRVGSSSAAPAVGQVALGSQLASTNNVIASLGGNASEAPYYGWYRFTYRFAAGEAAGTIAEVGVGWGDGEDEITYPATLFSRALVKNSVGEAVEVVVLGDEVLDVTYELRLYAPTADVTFDFSMSGVTYDCVVRPSLVNEQNWQPFYVFIDGGGIVPDLQAYSGAINPLVTGAPDGTAFNSSSAEGGAYIPGSFARSYSATFDLSAANFGVGGIQSCVINSLMIGTFQCSFDPPIAKDDTKILSLNYTYTLARYEP